jgi:hypothetical protein
MQYIKHILVAIVLKVITHPLVPPIVWNALPTHIFYYFIIFFLTIFYLFIIYNLFCFILLNLDVLLITPRENKEPAPSAQLAKLALPAFLLVTKLLLI